MNKKVLFAIFVSIIISYGSAQEILGKWTVESFGLKQKLLWEILSDNTIICEVNGEISAFEYSYDSDLNEFILFAPNMKIEMRIEKRNDCLYFYTISLERSPLYSQIMQTYKSMQGINSLTDEIAEDIMEMWNEQMKIIPFLKAYR